LGWCCHRAVNDDRTERLEGMMHNGPEQRRLMMSGKKKMRCMKRNPSDLV
jgi:hypothetical protein